jgi:hypothetical protein
VKQSGHGAPAEGEAPVQLAIDLAVPGEPASDRDHPDAPHGSGAQDTADPDDPDVTRDAQALFEGFEEEAAVYDAGAGHDTEGVGLKAGPAAENLAEALAAFRDSEIRPDQPQRSILRPRMIEVFVNEHLVDAGQWLERVPAYLRAGTNAAELKFLDRICAIVARLG